MNKRTRIIVIVGVAVVAAFLLYRYIRSRGNQGSGTGALGSNLNSVAPELVGGSSGPTQGPAVDVPVNITLVSSSTDPGSGKNTDLGANPVGPDSVGPQTAAALNQPISRVSQPMGPTALPASNQGKGNPVHSPVPGGNSPVRSVERGGPVHIPATSPQHANAMQGSRPTPSPMTAQHRAAAKTGASPKPQPHPGSHAAHHGRKK